MADLAFKVSIVTVPTLSFRKITGAESRCRGPARGLHWDHLWENHVQEIHSPGESVQEGTEKPCYFWWWNCIDLPESSRVFERAAV